jgi:predicted transcriptional regulator
MKAVLISIQPKWCELIASGNKTVEVRKTKPKLETPFKVYIYETQGRTETPFVDEEGHEIFKGRGKVIGEFVCDKIVKFENSIYDEALRETVARSCVPMYDLLVYIGKQTYGYGWHVSNLVIYEEPKTLGEFRLLGINKVWSSPHKLKRPPLSWCYVEERS